jgi:hypothetical protein
MLPTNSPTAGGSYLAGFCQPNLAAEPVEWDRFQILQRMRPVNKLQSLLIFRGILLALSLQ